MPSHPDRVRRNYFPSGWCNPGNTKDCSGFGRPSCQASECIYGCEPCPICKHFKPVNGKCGFVHDIKEQMS